MAQWRTRASSLHAQTTSWSTQGTMSRHMSKLPDAIASSCSPWCMGGTTLIVHVFAALHTRIAACEKAMLDLMQQTTRLKVPKVRSHVI